MGKFMSYIYAITFASGVTKFGKTKSLRSRLMDHDRAAKRHGDSTSSVIVATSIDMGSDESSVISLARERHYQIEGQKEAFMCNQAQADLCLKSSGLTPLYLSVKRRNGITVFELSEETRSNLTGMKIKPVDEDRLLSVISRESDGVTYGSIVNRIRGHGREAVDLALKYAMEKDLIDLVHVIHPKNGKTYSRYKIKC